MVLTVVPPPARRSARTRSSFTTTVRAEGTGTVVTLRGEVDFSAAPVLSEALSRVIVLRSGDVVIDLAELEFLDTAAVRVLMAGEHMLDREDRRLILRSPSRLAARVLQLFGLSDHTEANGAVQL